MLKDFLFNTFIKATQPLSHRKIVRSIWTKAPLIRRFYFLIFEYLKPGEPRLFDMQGIKIYVDFKRRDPLPRDVLAGRVFGGKVTELFKNKIKEDDIVLDLGASIGYYSLIASGLVGEKGKVYAFEPEPYNFNLLCRNIEVNGYKNIVPVRKAVLNRLETVKLFLDEESLEAHSLFSLNKENYILCESVVLDEFFQMNMKVDVIRMDIEGSEMLALLGMQKLLEFNKKIKIFSEFHPQGIKLSGFSPVEFLNKLTELGFRFFLIDQDEGKIRPSTPLEIKGISKFKDQIELFCER